MPHIVIEYSDNLANEVKDSKINELIHKHIVNTGLFSPESVKGRSISYKDYVLTEGSVSFMHITVSILSGRDEATRSGLGSSVFNLAKLAVPKCDKLSVNIHEMDGKTYAK